MPYMLKYTFSGSLLGERQIILYGFLELLIQGYPCAERFSGNRGPVTLDQLHTLIENAGLETLVDFEVISV